MDKEFAKAVGKTFGTSDVTMKEELTAMLRRFESTRLYRWQYLEYMTRDTWIDYDEETQVAWDSWEKMRLMQELLLGERCTICFATDHLRGGYTEETPSIGWIEVSFPWVEVWPADAQYWTKNIMIAGQHNPVRRLPLSK
jgi:hypothetical protein